MRRMLMEHAAHVASFLQANRFDIRPMLTRHVPNVASNFGQTF